MGNRGTTPSWDDEQIAKFGFFEHLDDMGRRLRAQMRQERQDRQLRLIRQYRSALRCWGHSAEPLPKGSNPVFYSKGELTEKHWLTILDDAEAFVKMSEPDVAKDRISFVQDRLLEARLYNPQVIKMHRSFT